MPSNACALHSLTVWTLGSVANGSVAVWSDCTFHKRHAAPPTSCCSFVTVLSSPVGAPDALPTVCAPPCGECQRLGSVAWPARRLAAGDGLFSGGLNNSHCSTPTCCDGRENARPGAASSRRQVMHLQCRIQVWCGIGVESLTHPFQAQASSYVAAVRCTSALPWLPSACYEF